MCKNNRFLILLIAVSIVSTSEGLRGGETVSSISTQHGTMLGMKFTPNGKFIVTSGQCSFGGDRRHGIRFWRVSDGKMVKQLDPPLASMIADIAISPNGRQLAASVFTDKNQGNDRFKLCLYDLTTFNLLHEIPLGLFAARTVKYSPDGSIIYAGCYGAEPTYAAIKMFNSATGAIEKEINSGGLGKFTAWKPKYLDISPDGSLIAATGYYGTFQLWKESDDIPICTVRADFSDLLGIAFSGDGKFLATFSEKGHSLHIYSVDTLLADPIDTSEAKVASIKTNGLINHIAMSPHGESVVIASNNSGREAILLAFPTGDLLASLLPWGQGKPVQSIAFSSDGKKLALKSKSLVTLHDLSPYEDKDNARRLLVANDPELRKLLDSLESQKENKTVFARYQEKYSEFIVEKLTTFGSMEQLVLSGEGVPGYRRAVDGKEIAKLDKLPNLRTLTLSNLILTSFDPIASLPHLQEIVFKSHTEIKDWRAIKRIERLEKLDISGVSLADGSQLKVVGELKRLKTLQLGGIGFHDRRFFEIFSERDLSFLSDLSDLEVLNLSGSNVTAVSATHLRGLKNLRVLDIKFTSIDDACSPYLAEMKTLDTARLGKISRKTLESLTLLPNLKNLEFNGSHVGLMDLAALSKARNLERLVVDDFWLPEPGITFVKRLPDMPEDERLAYEWIHLLSRINAQYREQANLRDRAPLYLGFLEDRREALDTYAELNNATIDLKRKRELCTSEARKAVGIAFKDYPEKREKMNKTIDALSR